MNPTSAGSHAAPRRLPATITRSLLALGVSIGLQAAELTDVTSALFSGSGNCSFCHDQWGRGLTDAQGGDVSIGTDWRATMMAHAFKDPLWQAVMESEAGRHPGLQRIIEDKCHTCHAPMARTQSRAHGIQTLNFDSARDMPLAHDGVSCTLCHQIQPANLGQPSSFTGRFDIAPTREIFGPYDDVFAGPMQRHVDYTPKLGPHVRDSALCATCHTLYTPILDAEGTVQGHFAEQVPFLEWRNSVYAQRGRHCQDCHMPRLDEPVKISSRPPWLEPRAPFWRHQFAGGNAFMLSLLRDHAPRFQPNAEPVQFETMIAKARQQLAQAATLTAQGHSADGTLEVRVEVENRAGHKFPTGHPYRRAWLHVRVTNRTHRTVFESGAVDDQGRLRIREDGFAPHRDLITRPGQIQIYEAVMGNAAGQATRSLLAATRFVKDNRLPPRGFRPEGPHHSETAIRGEAAQDTNFNAEAGGRDTVTYRIPVAAGEGPWVAEVALLYQAVPPEAVDHLRANPGPAARRFLKAYSATSHAPESVARTRIAL